MATAVLNPHTDLKKIRVNCSCCNRLLCYIYKQGAPALAHDVKINAASDLCFIEIKCGKCGNVVKISRVRLIEEL